MHSLEFRAAHLILSNVKEEARQWPCFIGPTGSGKTARAKEIANQLKLPLAVLLPGTALPEDILGLPRVVRNKTIWSLPDWAVEATAKPHLIFIDELDKARPETIGALLTLLSGLEIRGHKLHPGTKFLCAMQPVDRSDWLSTEAGKAMSARLVFIPLNYSRERLASKFNLDVAALVGAAGKEPDPHLPVLPVISDRQLEALFGFLSVTNKDDELALTITRGIAGERTEALLSVWKDASKTSAMSPQEVAKAVTTDLSLLEKLQVPELVAITSEVLVHGTPAAFRAVLEQIALRGTAEDWQNAIRSIPELLESLTQSSNSVYIFQASQSSEEEDIENAVKEFSEMVDRLNKLKGKK